MEVERRDDLAEIAMAVTRPWRPRQPLPLLMRTVTTVAGVFRQWPTTYRWTGQVDLSVDPPILSSRWTRTA